MSVGLFAASRQGDFARVDPTLARLIGRPPTPLRDVLEAAIPAARSIPPPIAGRQRSALIAMHNFDKACQADHRGRRE